MKRPLCITGRSFSPENEAILWTHALARGFTNSLWIPSTLVEKLQLQNEFQIPAISPIGIGASNGRRFFYNLSQLKCSQEELEKKLSDMISKSSCSTNKFCLNSDTDPLNTNGEPFPQIFVEEVRSRFKHHYHNNNNNNNNNNNSAVVPFSRYWATVEEAEYIFSSPFDPSFLREENAVTLHGDSFCPSVIYYNVCGTKNPNVFNTENCCRYFPVNFYGHKYSTMFAVSMKASAIRYKCLNSTLWLTTRRVKRHRCKILKDVEPLTFVVEDAFHLVNVAMTDNPDLLMNEAIYKFSHGPADDTPLTVEG